MRQFTLRVVEIAALGGLIRVTCEGDPQPVSAPGQVCLACLRPGPNNPESVVAAAYQPFLRVPIYPFRGQLGRPEFWVDAAHPYASGPAGDPRAGLQPGAMLDVIGPCGRGFNLAPGTAHLLVVAAGLERLLPLIHVAVKRRLAVAVITSFHDAPSSGLDPALLPADVELQRGPITGDLAAWAEVVALDVPDPLTRAQEIRALCPPRPATFVQALIAPPMPCGVGACQACWVETEHGRGLACVDGPVFAV